MYYLHQNMRLEQSPDMQDFATWLLNVGAGEQLDNLERLTIPQQMQCPDYTVSSLIQAIYPDIDVGEKDDQYFLDRNILAGTNDNVMELNANLLEKFPGEKKVLLSADSVEFDDPGMNKYQPYSVEYLNSLVSSSLPLARLALKVGCPIMFSALRSGPLNRKITANWTGLNRKKPDHQFQFYDFQNEKPQ
jgi:hypothetical protein